MIAAAIRGDRACTFAAAAATAAGIAATPTTAASCRARADGTACADSRRLLPGHSVGDSRCRRACPWRSTQQVCKRSSELVESLCQLELGPCAQVLEAHHGAHRGEGGGVVQPGAEGPEALQWRLQGQLEEAVQQRGPLHRWGTHREGGGLHWGRNAWTPVHGTNTAQPWGM